MTLQQRIAKETKIAVSKIPASYQIIGDIMLLKFMKIKSKNHKRKIAEIIMNILPSVKQVCEIKGITGEFREPDVKLISGNRTETIHKENGIVYYLDVSKIMFSKGNLNERQRLIKLVKSNEVIVDMFAGIGYFSLGLGKFSKAKKICAIEKSAASYRFLKENIRLNKLNNITAIMGDCRDFAGNMNNFADRVIMGYFSGTEQYIPAAINILKDKGIMHFHNSYKKQELWNKPMKHLSSLGNFKVLNKRKVKSIAPNTYHVVLDVCVKK